MKARILTALAVIPVILAVLFLLPREGVISLLGLLLLIAAWEWSGFIGVKSIAARGAYAVVVGLMMMALWSWGRSESNLTLLLWLTLAWWLVAAVWVASFPGKVNATAAALCGFLVLIPAWASLGRLYIWSPDGPQLLLMMLLVVWAADIGAFFSGKLFGRVKLAPRVSPNKTWEGVLGGIVAASLVAYAGARWFGLDVGAFVSLCIAVAALSIIGDLTVSMFKRHAGLKDSGGLFPGHGGLLDRMDSVAAAAPLFLLGLGWLGMATS
ncbi:MAG: phosphatidate cytidylyltransferase [Gammaproteobacteria bacterium]|nr:phosphatidate cytidylyltransferase [Gammaproteobacteria bacterium]